MPNFFEHYAQYFEYLGKKTTIPVLNLETVIVFDGNDTLIDSDQAKMTEVVKKGSAVLLNANLDSGEKLSMFATVLSFGTTGVLSGNILGVYTITIMRESEDEPWMYTMQMTGAAQASTET